jgi:rod shape determining protein RodA
MRKDPVINREGLDWVTVIIYLLLVFTGWFMLYSIHHDPNDPYAFLKPGTSIGQATIMVIVSVIVFFSSYIIDWKLWNIFSYPIFGFSILLLILVLFFGSNIKGSQSWFNIFGFSLQPSEIAKFGAALAVASFISHYKQALGQWKIMGLGLLLILVPMILILLQPDAGSAIVFFSLIFTFFRNGATPLILAIPLLVLLVFVSTLVYGFLIAGLIIVSIALLLITVIYYQNRFLIIGSFIFIIVLWILHTQTLSILSLILGILAFYGLAFYFWYKNPRNIRLSLFSSLLIILLFSGLTSFTFNKLLKPHQQERINVWLQPENSDPLGSLYNVMQSKMAIGSGGLTGKGFLEGAMTNLEYVPEQATDFIFTALGEEQGFLGVTGLIVLYLVLILRVISIGERSDNKFILSYAYAIGGYLFFHFFINIGMTMGLVPVIGIPLPFLSRGGSALMVFSMMLGVLLKLDTVRRLRY